MNHAPATLAFGLMLALSQACALAQGAQGAANPAPAESVSSTAPRQSATVTTVAAVPQRWQNRTEFYCRSTDEAAEQYQRRLNQRLVEIGAAGFELVAVTPVALTGVVRGVDCLAFSSKRPEAR